MGTIFSGDYSTGVNLTTSAQNPVLVTGTFAVASGNALSGSGTVDWTISNEGRISASATGIYLAGLGDFTNSGTLVGGGGIELLYGGFVSNAASGTIGGNTFGVLITDTLTTHATAGTFVNAGTVGLGPAGDSSEAAFLTDGGSVTNMANALLESSNRTVYLSNNSGSVTNFGTIISTRTVGTGVVLDGTAGGTEFLTNASTGLIDSGGYGIRSGIAPATIINSGTIIGQDNIAMIINSGGTIINGPNATISGGGLSGVRLWNGNAREVINEGLISDPRALRFSYGDSSYGINLTVGTTGPAYVSNAATGTIIGLSGVGIGGSPGTVVNAGTIMASGTNGYAVLFFRGNPNSLIIDPGAVFVGNSDGGNQIGGAAISTLELASAATTGTLSGIGSRYINFEQVTIDTAASWQWTGSNTIDIGASLSNTGTLKLLGANFTDYGGLTNNGIINVDPSTVTASSIGGVGTIQLGSNSTLTLTGSVGSGQTIIFDGTNATVNVLDPSGFAATIQNQGPTDMVDGLCLAAGTRIETTRGMVLVEALRLGDHIPIVAPQDQCAQAVVWIGHRHIDITRHSRPASVWPIRIRADAFGVGSPCRDLFLSPDHAVFIAGVLIPVKYLVNGTSIAQIPVQRVTYYHVELPNHSVLRAEGLPVESLLNTGRCRNFFDGEEPVVLHPDFASRVWEAEACLPLIVTGPALDRARRLLDRQSCAQQTCRTAGARRAA